ncbi:MAG: putative manganese-dependent inorganic diphosphatase [Lachnospiraceae bacterium]
MEDRVKKVWVLGHKNPDTDSICAAISYARLKNALNGVLHVAKRVGKINEETKYVLNYFGVQQPDLVTDVGAQVKDINYRKTAPVNRQISLKRAWELMRTKNVVTLPVTNHNQRVIGVIVTSDVATSYMDVYDIRTLAIAKTPYKNIVETLDGTMLTGNEHAFFMKGKVVVATNNTTYFEEYLEDDDLVISGDRVDAQNSAIMANASCLIVCSGFAVDKDTILQAERRDCVVISTPYDTFTVARLINQSMPISHFMTKDNIVTFDESDYIEDVKEVMSKIRHRDFPIIDDEGSYIGMMSRRNLLNMQKKQIILVDHNEKSQAVDGIEDAEILEIIDHHRLGSLETMSPVYFRNQPLGCTSTIIYQMYQEKNIPVTKEIAGLLCSAIISDTLMFRSPTCTEVDVAAAHELAVIAEIEIEQYAKDMFQAGSDFRKRTEEEIFYQDFKIFHTENADFGVAQISAMSKEELIYVKEKIEPYMKTARTDKNLDLIFLMLTDILDESTELISCGKNADKVIKKLKGVRELNGRHILPGVVSRKKQLLPSLISALNDD